MTAELAIALPAVVLVLALCLSGFQLAGQQLRVQDAAALAARSLGRGDAPSSIVDRLVPGASVSESRSGELVCATVSVRSATALGDLAGIDLSASSCALAGGR